MQYQKHYECFVNRYNASRLVITTETFRGITTESADPSEPSRVKIGVRKSASKRRLNSKRKVIDSVGYLMQNLTMKSDETEDTSRTQSTPQEVINETTPNNPIPSNSTFSSNSTSTKFSSTGSDGDKPHDDKPTTLKRTHEADFDEAAEGMETVKKAFSLMGYTFNESEKEVKLQGEVVYRKRHIRLPNRQLKMKVNRTKTNKHTYFDDNGVEITNTIDKVKQYLTYCPINLPTEGELEPNDKGSYTKAHFTSSSDEEFCDDNVGSKLHAKRLVFSKPSTSSLETPPDFSSSFKTCDDDDVFLEEKIGVEAQMEMDSNEVEVQSDVIIIKISDEDSVKKSQKKRRRKTNKRNVSLPAEVDNDRALMKYWVKRYRLFSKFDQGIKLDRGNYCDDF